MAKTKDENVADPFKESVMKEFMTIEAVGAVSAEKLYEGGYYTIIDIGASSPSSLSEKTSIAIDSASKIIANAMKIADVGEFMTGMEAYEQEKIAPLLSTGCESLDVLLGGGMSTGIITEMSAPNGVGKTQLAFTLAVMATRPLEEGGFDTDVIYIDTENTYRAGRVYMIAEARGYDPEDVLNRIHVIKVNNSAHQVLVLNKAKKLSAEKGGIKLLIVDSIISHFRAEYLGRGTLSERQQQLGKHLNELADFSRNNNAVVYVTNQVQARPDAFFGDPNIPTGGNVMGHFNANRLYMRKGKASKRVVRLLKAPNRPEGECVIQLTERGIDDA